SGADSLAALRSGLAQWIVGDAADRLVAPTAAAMSASIGVDFTVQVGLLPQFHQPMFVLLLFGSDI
ncbi:unnamed protein product, partial [Symbiodinium sp. CCMP2592]